MVKRALALLSLLAVGCARPPAPVVASEIAIAAPAPASEPSDPSGEAKRLEAEARRLYEAENYDEAATRAERALVLRERSIGADHLVTSRVRVLVARIHASLGDHAHLEAEVTRARAVFERELGPENADVADALRALATGAIHRRDYPAGKELLLRAVAILEVSGPPEDLSDALNGLGLVHTHVRDFPRAKEVILRSLAMAEAQDPESTRTAMRLGNLAEMFRHEGNALEAEAPAVRALRIVEKRLGPDHPRVGTARNNLAALYHYSKKDLARAEPLYRGALAIYENRFPPESVRIAQVRINLGLLLCAKGDWAEGEPLFNVGLAAFEKVVGHSHAEVGYTRAHFANLQRTRPPQTP